METRQILETIQMISEERLDIRTITMGISLFDCIDSDGEKARQKSTIRLRRAPKTWLKLPMKFNLSTAFQSSTNGFR